MSRILEALGSSVRASIAAPPGRTFAVCDLSSIEVWVIGWLTRCEGINRMAREKKDPYKAFAEIWLDVPYDQVDKATRTMCKPPMLGSGYRLSAGEQVDEDTFTGLMAYGRQMGIEMTQEQAKHATEVYRSRFREVVQWWYWWENTVARVVVEGIEISGFGLTFRHEGDFLTIQLPSGRKLWYHRPAWELVTTPWGAKKYSFTYWGKEQEHGQWRKISNHGGRGVEQATQAIARDVLVHGMLEFERRALFGEVIGHIHDEAIVETYDGIGEETLDLLTECLSITPPWAPGLILGAEGYVAKRYRKG